LAVALEEDGQDLGRVYQRSSAGSPTRVTLRAPVGRQHHESDPATREDDDMPEKKHLRGVGEKEQRQYEEIKKDAESSGRYGKRAEEVAARTVMKEHKRKGHKPGE
jgi:hypothetical protein